MRFKFSALLVVIAIAMALGMSVGTSNAQTPPAEGKSVDIPPVGPGNPQATRTVDTDKGPVTVSARFDRVLPSEIASAAHLTSEQAEGKNLPLTRSSAVKGTNKVSGPQPLAFGAGCGWATVTYSQPSYAFTTSTYWCWRYGLVTSVSPTYVTSPTWALPFFHWEHASTWSQNYGSYAEGNGRNELWWGVGWFSVMQGSARTRAILYPSGYFKAQAWFVWFG